MAVVRDYLITQFTFYGLSVFTNQLKSFADTFSELTLNRQLQKANISLDTFRARSAMLAGDFSVVSSQSSKINSELQKILRSADKLQTTLASIQVAQLPVSGQRSFNRLVTNLDRIRNLSADAISSFSKGDFEKAQRYIERLNNVLDASTKSLRNIQRYSTPQRFGATSSIMKSDLAKIISDFTSFNLKIGSMGLEKLNKQTIQTISKISELSNKIRQFLIPSIVGFAVTAVGSFFLVSRAIYNVTENIRDAYRLTVDLGIGIKGALALARSLNMFGFDVNVISQATMKLSEAITKNQLAGRLMLGWLGLSPYQLQGKDTLEVLDTVLDKIMRLPSVSLRKTIGKELLGERFPELLMMKEMGYLDTIRQLNARYSEDYIKKVMQTAKAWAIVKMNIQDIGINLANNILPLVNQLVVFTNYLAENSQVLFGIITGLGVLFTVLKKPLIGIPMIFLGIAGLINSFKSESNNNLSTIANELRAQTRIMDLQYRTLNTIRLQLNQFIATTVRQTPNLYQASIYRSLLTNTGGI